MCSRRSSPHCPPSVLSSPPPLRRSCATRVTSSCSTTPCCRSREAGRRRAAAKPAIVVRISRAAVLCMTSCEYIWCVSIAELKITAGYWPFSVQFSTMATQILIMTVSKLYRWPIKNSVLASQTQSLIFSSAMIGMLIVSALNSTLLHPTPPCI